MSDSFSEIAFHEKQEIAYQEKQKKQKLENYKSKLHSNKEESFLGELKNLIEKHKIDRSKFDYIYAKYIEECLKNLQDYVLETTKFLGPG